MEVPDTTQNNARNSNKQYENVNELQSEKKEPEKYEVDKIIKKGLDEAGKVYYKVKWKNHSESKSTWEPVENLGDLIDLIQVYEIELKKKQKKYMITPKKVNFAKYYKNKLYVNVTWEEPASFAGSKNSLPTTMVAYEELREKFPKLLIDFYETRIKYGNKDLIINPDSTCILK